MADRWMSWDEMSPGMREEQLALHRALFEEPDWTPPEGHTVQVIELPADFLDELDADHFAEFVKKYTEH